MPRQCASPRALRLAAQRVGRAAFAEQAAAEALPKMPVADSDRDAALLPLACHAGLPCTAAAKQVMCVSCRCWPGQEQGWKSGAWVAGEPAH